MRLAITALKRIAQLNRCSKDHTRVGYADSRQRNVHKFSYAQTDEFEINPSGILYHAGHCACSSICFYLRSLSASSDEV
jgi:hypothetical protein